MTSVPEDGPEVGGGAPSRISTRTAKFRNRQAAIIRVAVGLINKKGVRGMTLVEVAAQLDIVPTGVIYYFPSKERLAAACFLEAIAAYEELIAEANAGATRRERLERFVRRYVGRAGDIAAGRRDALAVFNDVRALEDPVVNAAYVDMFRRARSLIAEPPPHGPRRQALNAVTHLVLSQLFWSVVWLPLYDVEDYDRAAIRILEIFEHGLAAHPVEWPRDPVVAEDAWGPNADVSRETFLRAATQTINEHGYLGASVDKISSRLNVTKGSFYHHNEAKDDLVVACFNRTLEVMRRTLRQAMRSEADGRMRLSAAAMSLVACQLSGETPLLRTSALTSAPEAMQSALIADFDRVSLTISAMISDGVTDGSVRAVDAHVGAQMVTAMINAAAELEHWAPGLGPRAATEAYAGALLNGLWSVVGAA
jgi:AcrR family transcriptional regulator